MPWDVFKEDDEYCVYQIDEDDQKTGKTLGCHPTADEAREQVEALYANEPEAAEAKSAKATWTAAQINDLPDSAFLYIESGGEKDDEGKTTPRSLRHFPYKDASGAVDLPHLRNALARIPQSNLPDSVKTSLAKKAQDILEKEQEKSIDLDELRAVKALGQNRLGGYLVLWGDETQKDLSGEYFTPHTQGLTTIFETVGRVPMLYAHGKDGALEFHPVGTYDVMAPDEVGLWAEGELAKANQYRDAIRQLVARSALGQSSQTLVSARKVAPNGHIDRWVIAEGSLTPTPCEPRMMDRPVSEIKAAYKALSLELPELEQEPDAKGDEESRGRDHELALEAERIALLDL